MKKEDKHKIYDIIKEIRRRKNDDKIDISFYYHLTEKIKKIVENDKCEFTGKEMADFAMHNPYEM